MPVAPLSIDSLRLSVAPMMDWTDSHCRVFHRLLAPRARLYTEMVHANAVLQGDRARLLARDPVENPVALQLGGSDPALLAGAARVGQEHGFDEINLNVGCPSDRVQAGRFGACLMKEPTLVADSVSAMVAAVDIPVTVKCRLGVDEENDYDRFAGFIDTVASAGCRIFFVHARNAWLKGLSPKQNREVPPLRYDWAYRIKRERPDLIIAVNGGIATVEDSLLHLQHTDGVMLGRAAYHDPYLLHRLDAALSGGETLPRAQLLRAMRPYVESRLDQGLALKHIARHLLGLFHGQPGGRAFRQVLSEGAHRNGADWTLVEQAIAATESRLQSAA
ncbi:tRNA dihydrouridine(20/20a) synthase DusA [Pseudoxanthomonas sacheonensis]|uniref:tRNA-dihydrouridine(20/20a) synthase n=1 Tax=Pseudoxanthomonas sacheonensis TaxID=443615 RepID=A0ABU1RVF3_9GAMM|nr:tRNA dihydrouridine(20/20a) synthase DusA [Pseudoxanthomonas sacheonensis]MDR6842747.1 tRNA-dihydrouridine synthase A [Pseudoxanthomonas sacheonensis]